MREEDWDWERVPAPYLAEIEREAQIYRALCQAGVDNWDGFDYAMEILEEMNARN